MTEESVFKKMLCWNTTGVPPPQLLRTTPALTSTVLSGDRCHCWKSNGSQPSRRRSSNLRGQTRSGEADLTFPQLELSHSCFPSRRAGFPPSYILSLSATSPPPSIGNSLFRSELLGHFFPHPSAVNGPTHRTHR